MKSWRKKGYILLVVGVLLGALIFGYSKIHSIYVLRNNASDKVRAELTDGEFTIAVGNACWGESTGVGPYIKWWYNWEDGKYYLFLPKSWETDYRTFWVFNNEQEMVVGDRKIVCGDYFEKKEGEYVVETNAGQYTVVVMYSSDIASMFLETETGVLDYIHESKEIIEAAEYMLFTSKGVLNNYGSIAEFACRGNVSFKFTNKKSYRVKMQEKSQLLDMGAGKDWALLASPFDRSLSRNMLVNALAKELDMDFVPDMVYVDLYANGEYQGNYVLVEKIEVNSERVNIQDLSEANELANPGLDFTSCEQVVEDPDKLFSRKWWKIPNEPKNNTGGYLMEIEMLDRYGLEASGFITTRMQGVVIHNPKYATEEQIGYIAGMYQDFEDALFSEDGYNVETEKYFYEYIDMDSFAMKYILEEFVKNQDASVTSCYIYKPEYDDVIHAGPIWDYDLAININDIAGNGIDLKEPEGFYVAARENNSDSDIWWGLYQQEYFREYVDKVYEEEFKEIATQFVEESIDRNANDILNSAMMNYMRWNLEKPEEYDMVSDIFLEHNEGLKVFLQTRLEWLDEAWKYEK